MFLRINSLLGAAVRTAQGPVQRRSVKTAFRRYATASSSMEASEEPLFSKVLVANRGEIAVRIMQTCRRLGIKTVAVYSDADAMSKHVEYADEAVHIGPSPSSESYLIMDKIIDACKQTGAAAVHPGYGFLSENGAFEKRLRTEGITFIGPKAEAMKAMGDKIESKIIAKKAGVNTIPGFDGVVEDVTKAVEISKEIGYPVMVKASAGGGGKGMRIAWNDKEVEEAFTLCKAEAKSSFGDDRLLIEKFVNNPRHIEIQIIADKLGNTVYLNERECSVQRRNQKVVEEAPSTFIDPETRKMMGQQACQLARAVDYHTAGTVEMLIDDQKNFYFLEMNTRLQVEHPVTELISQVDLVEQMIRAAAGKKIQVDQETLKIHGWAVECRVYAEDPVNYLPSIGRLGTYVEPTSELLDPEENSIIRVDSGIKEGSEISIFYDPMISKLITHGPTREAAVNAMNHALDNYIIKGVTHNMPLLRDILSHPRFLSGDITTKFLEEEYPDGFATPVLNEDDRMNVVGAVLSNYLEAEARANVFNGDGEDTIFLKQEKGVDLAVTLGGNVINVNVGRVPRESHYDEHAMFVVTDKDTGRESVVRPVTGYGEPIMKVAVDEELHTFQYLEHKPEGMTLRFKGSVHDVLVRSERAQGLYGVIPEKPKIDMSAFVVTPMPGTVVSVAVAEGDTVAAGMEVAVVEAMKMQNSLRAERSGKIKSIRAVVGESLNDGDIIVEFEDEASGE